MPYNERTPGGGSSQAAHQFQITRALALTILGAGILIFLLRHIYGSIAIEAGAK